ncbi:Serine/threonine-protein kinase [Wilcoxina mikolae CBS 423.85]|nr:Serine/threonine-protein kinase [Wilcoxina mikolae CBS 423.85]
MSAQHHTPRTPLNKKNNAKNTLKVPEGSLDVSVPPSKKSKTHVSPSQSHSLMPGGVSLGYQQIQKDELEVLQSVFMDDYKYIERAGAWNKSDHEIKLRLKASSNQEYSCVLSVLMTATYPKTAPEMTISVVDHIRPHELARLQELIKQMPRRLIGQEMIYEIAVALQDALEDIVQTRLMDQHKPSLDQERALKAISEQKRAEQEEEEIRQQQEKKAREEQMKLEKEIEDERRRQREQAKETHEKRRISTLLIEEGSSGADTEDCVLFDRTIKINPPDGGEGFVFRKVCGMVKIAQGPLMTVYTVRPASLVYESRNVPLILKQVELPDSFVECSEGKLQIQGLEQEIDSLRSLRHPNVTALYESKVTRSSAIPVTHAGSCSNGGWRVSILMEYANKGSLHDLLEAVDCIGADIARSWTIALLEGLDYIHRNGAVHCGIHAGNILLFRHGSGNHTVPKLSDISYTKTIREITNRASPNVSGSSKPSYWLPPEASQLGTTPNRKATRKTDIWYLGVVFLQMIFGLKVVETYESPQKLFDSMNLSDSLSDFLESIFRPDPKKRPTAFELLPSEFLRNDDPITKFPQPTTSARSPSRMSWSISNNHQIRHQSRGRHNSFLGGSGLSRYASDFVELGSLGKGGYGQVVKARNRLDGREYAIKQITQTSGAKLTEILSEVMLLSRLNHRYVVRYFTAWLEDQDALIGGSVFMEETEDEDSNAISFTESSVSGTRSDGDEHPTGNSIGESKDSQSSSEGSDGIEVEFGHSTGGLDFISNSAGYPNVEFGYDSGDSEEEDSDEDEDENSTASKQSAKTNALRRITSAERRRGKVTLYIQMSLAERLTLRDRIRQGIGLEECWKLLRQILEGLAHIHGLGIIHRDLKPENIFIDLSGDPQLGDFGLATLQDNKGQTDKVTGESTYGDNELTTNVGTALYVAPELRGQSSGNYNEKVDMYSLGIIFFEMVYPLNSGMERAQVLSKLREPDVTFPAEFWTDKRTVQGNIIKTLLCHNPAERPSSSELLNSGKLPFMIEDKTIRHALQSLSDPNTPYHSQVMQALFSQNTKEYKNHTYDTEKKDLTAHDLLLQSLVKERLTYIFRNHGAVETSRLLLMPRSKLYSRDVVQLMDPNGTLVQLPYDLTLPHARFLAKSKAPAPKTFTFGTVYRENSGGGQPGSHGEVDFDIVSYDSVDLSLQEAEVIKVVDEVIDAFPSLKGAQMCYHLNHSDLLDAVMEFCRISSPARAHAKEILSKLNHRQWVWTKIRNELATSKLGILPTSLDDLSHFDWRDEPEKAFERLREIFEGTTYVEKVKPICERLRAVIAYLRQFGVHRKVYVNPLGTYNDKFYRGGIVFQCIYDTKKRDVFAAGGRYDSLIQEHRPKMYGHAEETHAVGCNLGWEQLFKSMAKYNRSVVKAITSKHAITEDDHHSTSAWVTRRCDVIVSTFDSSTLHSPAISLLQELWANGIRAELGQDTTGQESLLHHYKNDGASWIVTVKQGIVGERTLKVKSLRTKQDIELKNSELISWLKTELAERHLKSMAAERHLPIRLPRYSSADLVPRAVAEEQHPDMDVRILASERKNRKVNRTAIIDAAQRTASEISNAYLKCPIAAVDMKEDILEQIKLIGLQDAEGWKKLLQSSPAQDRKYVLGVQELLEQLKSEGNRECWIFSFRAGNGGIVHLQ